MPQAESEVSADLLHGLILGQDIGDDSFHLLFTGDVKKAAKQLGAQAEALKLIADQDRELGVAGGVSLINRPTAIISGLPVTGSVRSATNAISRS